MTIDGLITCSELIFVNSIYSKIFGEFQICINNIYTDILIEQVTRLDEEIVRNSEWFLKMIFENFRKKKDEKKLNKWKISVKA